MSFAMVVGGLAVAGGSVASALIGGNAAQSAANSQSQAAEQGIQVQQNEFNQIQKLLSPFSNAGDSSEKAQMNLLGLNGNAAQSQAINGIQNGSQFKALNAQGQNAILQNAAATGGLRGGNVQGALAQFSPALLQSLIQQQYTNLGGITSLGENAAAQTGNAGQNMANNVSNLYGNIGQAQASGALGSANAAMSGINGAIGGLGVLSGNGAFGSLSSGLSGLFNSFGGSGASDDFS